jgi:repressor LexA
MNTLNPDYIITPKQLAVLREIEAFQSSRCYSPTMEEMALSLGVSRPTVFEHIEELREKGLIESSRGRAPVRSLLVTKAAKKLLKRVEQAADDDSASPSDPTIIPMLGCVSAGYGIEAEPDSQPLGLTEFFGQVINLFALRVQGDSMIDAGIADGDYIICKYSPTAENGQIVIALLEGQKATVKRFFQDKKSVRLAPDNDAFEPILSTDCRIQAIVIGLIRRL